jgi:hypothetical protein
MSKFGLLANTSGTATFTITSPATNTNRILRLPDATGTFNISGLANEVPAGSNAAPAIYPTGDNNTGVFFPAADTIAFGSGAIERMRIDSSGTTSFTGNAVPSVTNSYDLGTASLRWRNIYTQDLHLSNGIGDYTVVEGEEDLFLVNNKSGKTFKFALIEVEATEVPPRSNV